MEHTRGYGGLTVDPNGKILGGQLCAWGDRLSWLKGEKIRSGIEDELTMIRERLPALAEKTWNRDSQETPDAFRAAYEKTDLLLTQISPSFKE